MRVYLDSCCLNRPFDDQSQLRVRLEVEAKLDVQQRVLSGELDLAWSYMLDYENVMNPFVERRRAIGQWRSRAVVDVGETPGILRRAEELHGQGISSKDALHVACALAAGCDFFITTDDLVLKRAAEVKRIRIVDPPTFLREVTRDY